MSGLVNAGVRRVPVVALGASAGGVEALETFLAGAPVERGVAYVVVLHLERRHPSPLVEVLARHTPLPVQEVTDGEPLRANHVHVIPPNAVLTLERGLLRLAPPEGTPPVVDLFFRSLAEDAGELAVGVVLAGVGEDGAQGLRAIKEHGGLALAEDPRTARQDGAPLGPVQGSHADEVLPVDRMVRRVLDHLDAVLAAPRTDATSEAAVQELLPQVCAQLKHHTAHDFARYKPGTLLRRVRRRVQLVRAPSAAEYLARLQEDAGEARALLKDLLIGVTQFFRDAPAFAALAERVIPALLAETPAERPVRVWVPGCSTGEEVYSLAMLLDEQLRQARSRRTVQLFATDIDVDALATARAGLYAPEVADHVSPQRLERYFSRSGERWQVAKELREMCVFSVHSLVRDPPFSFQGLISCRNLLIYLSDELQERALALFHYALRPGGFLFLGPSEELGTQADLFDALDKQHHLFRRREALTRPALEFPVPGARGRPESGVERPARSPRQGVAQAFERLVLERFAPASAVVDERGGLLCVAGQVSRYLHPPAGVFTSNVFDQAQGPLRHVLRTALAECVAARLPVVREDLLLPVDGVPRRHRLTLRPAPGVPAHAGLYALFLEDLGTAGGTTLSEPPLEPAVEHLEHELQSTRVELQAAVEDLESTNEELTCSNEELVSTNEELHSANEELQASKEELQSVNEELETVNSELRHKVAQLAVANGDLLNLFAATQVATVFLDLELRVSRFTPAATALFHFIDGDVGRPLADLAPRFAGANLVADARQVLATLNVVEREVEADGRWFIVRVLPYRTVDNQVAGVVTTFLDVTRLRRAEEARAESERLLREVLDASPALVFLKDVEGRLLSVNARVEEVLGRSREQLRGLSDLDLFSPSVAEIYRANDRRVLESGQPLDVEEVVHGPGGDRWFLATKFPLRDAAGNVVGVAGMSHEITERRRAEEKARRYAQLLQLAQDAILVRRLDGEVELWSRGAEELYGFTEAEACGRISHELLQTRFPVSLAEMETTLTREGRWEGQLSHVTKDGRTVVVSARKQLVRGEDGVDRVLESNRDITAALETERVLRHSEERFRQLVETAPDAVFTNRDGRVEYVNPAALRLFGVDTPEALLGRNPFELFPPDYHPQMQARIAQLVAGGQVPSSVTRVLRLDGGVRAVEITGALFRDARGPAIQVTLRDITARVEAEEALRRTTALLEAVNVATPTLMYGKDREGRLTYANPALLRLLDRSLEQALGRTSQELVPGPEGADHSANDRWVLAHGVTRSFEEPVTASGDKRTFLSVKTPLRDADGAILGVVGVSMDITDQKRLEERLRASEERYRHLFESMTEGFADHEILLDEHGTPVDYRFLSVNPAFERLTGLAASRVVGHTQREAIPGEDPLWVRAYGAVALTGQPAQFDNYSPALKRHFQVIAFRSGPGRFAVLFMDITERKLAEAQLRESEVHFRTLTEGMPQLVWMADTEGRTLYRNRRWDEYLGTAVQPDSGWAGLMHPEDRTAALSAWQAAVRDAQEFHAEFRLRRHDGEERWQLARAWPSRDEHGTITRWLGTVTDIHDLKQSAAALQQSQERHRQAAEDLREADQRKNDFLAMLSHELRNPLAPIRNSLYVLQHAGTAAAPALRAQMVIDRQVGHLARLVDDLLDVTRITRNKIQLRREPLDLAALVRRTVEDHRSLFEGNGIALEVQVPATALPARLDGTRVAQVVGNLLQNAAKFTPAGGHTRVSLEVDGLAPQAVLRVTDSGAGMTPELVKHLFQPFMQADRTLDRSKGGLGLGLALVKGLVELHGGQVRADSAGPGTGAQFTVHLPLESVPVAPEPAAPVTTPAPALQVLIIEDNVDSADSLRTVLELLGFQAAVAHSGAAGLTAAQRSPPDVVLCDIGLPGMDGYAVAKALRADPALRTVFLVALSGYAQPEDLQQATAAGFDCHLAKPPDLNKLREILVSVPARVSAR